jgi:osmotically-inducible protein OsmY
MDEARSLPRHLPALAPLASSGGRKMRKIIWMRSFIALALMETIAGCTASASRESTGEYVDDTVITSKVKAAVLAEPGLQTLQIGVETYKNVVQLSGFVDTAQARSRAGVLAANVQGVRSVRNDLVVK